MDTDINLTRQCNATSRSGERCKRRPIPGGNVCVMHGGSAPQVRRQAEEALIEARVPAARVLRSIVEAYNRTACEHCGRGDDPNPVIKAAIAVLDRTGFGPSSSLRVEVQHSIPDNLQREQLIARLERMLAVLRAQQEEEEREVVDAVVLPEVSDE